MTSAGLVERQSQFLILEHAHSAALFQLLTEKGGCLKGKKPFSTKTSSARALRPVSEKPFAFPLTESEDVTSLMTSGNRKLESERNKLQRGSRCLTTNSLSEEEQYLDFITGYHQMAAPGPHLDHVMLLSGPVTHL